MSTFNGANLAKATVNFPFDKYGKGDAGGDSVILYDSFTPAAEFAVGDIIQMGMIPASARVVSAILKTPALTQGTFEFGNAASADAVEAAVATGFIGATDCSSAVFVNGTGSQLLHRFVSPVMAQLQCTVLSTAATGLTIATMLHYVLN